MQAIRSSARIVLDAAAYRVRKREAGNLVTSMTLAAALMLPVGEIAVRLAFGLVLNLFVYLVNDCYDVDVDLAAPGRDVPRTRFLADHRREGVMACVGLAAALLALAALYGHGLLETFVVNLVVIVAYSAKLKHTPLVDVATMAVWGVSMAMVGFPPSSMAGWRFAGFLGALCAVTETVQVLRDEPSDRAAGVRSTAVAIGPAKAAALGRALIVVAAAYGALFLHRWLALPTLAGAFAPLTPARAERSWDVLRVLFGITWLALLAAFVHRGATWGWLDPR